MSAGHRIALPTPFSSAGEPAADNFAGASCWRRLDPERRLQLVARALRQSDGIIDVFPLAL